MIKGIVRYEDGKPANVRMSQCAGKHPFDSQSLARKVAERGHGRDRYPRSVYRCPDCGKWHLTS